MENIHNLNETGRRSFLGNIIKASVLGLLPSGLSYGAPLKKVAIRAKASRIFLTRPYMQVLEEDGFTVMWITTVPCKSWVECADGSGKATIYTATHMGLVDAYNYVNKITVKGLSPGTHYLYKAVSEEIVVFKPYAIEWGNVEESETYSLTTVSKNTEMVSCIVYNDIHDRPDSFAQLFNWVKDIPFDFAVLNGDMFDYETDQQQIVNHLLNPLGELFSTVKPFYFQRGNHETRGKFARHHFDYVFDSPGYYAFAQGHVHFTFLDTGEDKEDNHKEYSGLVSFDAYREQQSLWFKAVSQGSTFKKASFRVVFMHIPPYYSGDWHGTLHCRQLFVGLFNHAKIDLLICGHTHVYGLHPATKDHHFPIVIGGGPLSGKKTVMSLEVDKKKLDLKMFRDDGTVVERLTLDAK